MNRKLQLCLFTVILPFALVAQTKKETVELTQAEQSRNYYTDSTQQQTLSFARLNSYYLNSLIPDKVSKASASYNFQKGNYIPSQGATSINAGSFDTEGAVKLGTIKLFGGFSYQKTVEDSTRFAHQTRNNTTTPYYFGSPAYVHYERSVYAFKAMANRDFLDDKLSLGLGTDYKVGDHYSTNDPRGSVGEYQFDLMASLGYKLTNRFKIGMAYRNGNGQERVNVGYKNPRYYESSSYPMYYNHLINGYGEGKPALTDRKYTDNQKRNGFDLYLDINTRTMGDFYFSGTYLTEHQRYFYSASTGFIDYALYDLNTTGFNLLWLKKLDRQYMGLLLNYSIQEGKDYNLTYAANNYIFSSHVASAKFFLNTNGTKKNYTHYLLVKQNDDERLDGITGNDIYFKNLLLTAGSGFRKINTNQSFFGINLNVNYKLPLSDTFHVAQSAEGYFTRYVIYHDYLYNTSSYMGGEFSAEYGKPVFKSMLAAVKMNMNYARRTSEKTLNRTLASLPGNDRFSSTISLNIYF